MARATANAEGVATSNATETATTTEDTALVTPSPGPLTAAQVIGMGLSQATVEKLSIELREKLAQITMGLDDKIKASKILERGDEFHIIDATILKDYEDKRNGTISDKHVFVLEFPQGDIQVIMQSDAAPRARISSMFQDARALGLRAIAGPYKMLEKEVGQINPALIFEKQPGFQAKVV